MAYQSIKNRLRKVQRNAHAGDNLGRIAELIARGAYFDELSTEERATYREYKESLGGVADDIAGAELEIMFFDKTQEEAYHFPLTKRRRPLTKEEYAQRVREVEEYVLELQDEYNAPEAVEKRKAEYEEMHRIAEQRRAAFMRGEPWDDYPLPWERGKSER